MRKIKNKNHIFTEIPKEKHKELFLIEKLFRVYEALLSLEEQLGKFIPFEELEKFIKSYKKIKPKISVRELHSLLNKLLASGVIFYPRKGFVQRIYTFSWKDVKR